MEASRLELKFDPATIEDLGIKMYSQLPSALAELVANAYDASAESVEIKLFDHDNEKRIEIIDDGTGMSYADIQEKFLVIGRKQRRENAPRENQKGRRITGKKGLGKLALFGIGKRITITTKTKGALEETQFILDWDEIINSKGIYNPESHISQCTNANESGTKIVLEELKRRSSFDLNNIAVSLSKMFNCLSEDFKVTISLNNDPSTVVLLTRELRYNNVKTQFEWDVTSVAKNIESDYDYKKYLKGSIISTRFPAKSELRGICLYANGRLINNPSFFGLPEAEHVYSYLSGWIDADYIDEFDEDLMSTDRQSLNWDMHEADELRTFLQRLIRQIASEWNEKRKVERKNKRKEVTEIDFDKWRSTLSPNMRAPLDETINYLEKMEGLDDNDFKNIVQDMHKLIPEYAQYHFRTLHPAIKEASYDSYKAGDYYTSIFEACKKYYDYIGNKAIEHNLPKDELVDNRGRFGQVFGRKIIEIASNVRKRDGNKFEDSTINSIQESQRLLSEGIYTGFRNPIAHELVIELRESGLIAEQHCLDALSLLSMLFYRIDNS